MKVWVLTGDKQETAINIGFASRQLTQDMELLVVNDTSLMVSVLSLSLSSPPSLSLPLFLSFFLSFSLSPPFHALTNTFSHIQEVEAKLKSYIGHYHSKALEQEINVRTVCMFTHLPL